MGAAVRCRWCGEEIRPGQMALEFRRGLVADGKIIAAETFGVWCEPCEADRRMLSLERREAWGKKS